MVKRKDSTPYPFVSVISVIGVERIFCFDGGTNPFLFVLGDITCVKSL